MQFIVYLMDILTQKGHQRFYTAQSASRGLESCLESARYGVCAGFIQPLLPTPGKLRARGDMDRKADQSAPALWIGDARRRVYGVVHETKAK